MKLVVNIDPADQEFACGPNRMTHDEIDAMLRRRLASAGEIQVQGFIATIVGEVTAEDCPGDQRIMAVEPLEGS